MRSSITFRYFKFFAALGTGGILACCLLMYLLLDLTFTPKKTAIKDSVENVSSQLHIVTFRVTNYNIFFFVNRINGFILKID